MRGVKLAADHARAHAEGFNEMEDRIPMLKRIHVHYTLAIPAGTREIADKALERHVGKCPTARSLEGAVEITWDAEITESEE